MKKKCDCGEVATWLYMPGYVNGDNPYSCDDCVPRGCSCNHYYLAEDYNPVPVVENDGEEGVGWKWVDKEKTAWTHIDEKGREYPCCEYDHSPEGYDDDDDFGNEEIYH